MAEDTVILGEFDPIHLTGFNRTIAIQSTMFGGPNPEQVNEMSEWLSTENVKFER